MTDSFDNQTVSTTTRWIVMVSAIILVGFGGLAVVHGWWTSRQREALDEALAAWSAKTAEYGTTAEIYAWFEREPPEPNAADLLDGLPPPMEPFLTGFRSPSMMELRKGYALGEFGVRGGGEPVPPASLTEAHYDIAREYLASNATFLAAFSEAIHVDDYYRPPPATIPGAATFFFPGHLHDYQTMARVLVVEARCAAYEGDYERFTNALAGYVTLALHATGEPYVAARFQAEIDAGQALDLVRHALVVGQPGAEHLLTWANTLERLAAMPSQRMHFLLETAATNEALLDPETDDPYGFWQDDFREGIYQLSGLAEKDHREFLVTSGMLLDAIDLPPLKKIQRVERLRRRVKTLSVRSAYFMGSDQIDRYLVQPAETQATLRCALAALAVEEHRLEHGLLPVDLVAIDTSLSPIIEDDPFTGAPLHYMVLGDAYAVYSAGRDQLDGGADLRTDDIVFRVERASGSDR